MRVHVHRLIGLLIILASALSACAPSATATQVPAADATSSQVSAPSPEVDIPTVVPTDAPGVLIPSGANMLVMLRGEARITHDNGGTWTSSGTGQYLQAGDEIQISEDALALVFLLNGGVVRLEGLSDFQILRAEREAETGTTRIILKLWDGYGLFESNPLPTADSIFQFHVMTTFVGLEYDPPLANAIGPDAALDPDRSVVAGGVLNEETERLYHFRGPASLYLLDQTEGITFAAELPTAPDAYADLGAAFLDDYELESELEAFGITAGYLIAECKRLGSCEGVDISGHTVARVEELETGQTLYFFGRASTVEPQDPFASATLTDAVQGLKLLAAQQAQAAASGSPVRRVVLGRTTWRTMTGLPSASRRPSVSALEPEILADSAPDFGCDPASGSGCLPPSGCDPTTGAACELPTGCNLVTLAGCQLTGRAPTAQPEPDAAGGLHGYRVDVPGAVEPGCDPNAPGSCDSRYDLSQWTYFEEPDDEDEVAACWCPANPPPPGYGPPPPGTFMYYRCFCSDPGAMQNRPAG